MLSNHIIQNLAELTIDSDPLRLRPWQPSDVDMLVAAVQESVPSVGRWLTWCRSDYGAAEANAWITHCERGLRDASHLALAIFDQRDDTLVGAVGLNQFNRTHHSANLGYWIRQSRQRRGLCTLAATRLARFAFEQLDLIRIDIVTLPDNLCSRRTAKKIGARFETVARNRLWHDGQPRDGAVYSLIPRDLRQP